MAGVFTACSDLSALFIVLFPCLYDCKGEKKKKKSVKKQNKNGLAWREINEESENAAHGP